MCHDGYIFKIKFNYVVPSVSYTRKFSLPQICHLLFINEAQFNFISETENSVGWIDIKPRTLFGPIVV